MKTVGSAVIGMVLLGGLVGGSSGTKPGLQLRSTPEDYRSQGLALYSVKPWEDGRRTDQGGSNFEWWYFDALTDDGTAIVVTFSDNITGDHRRQVVVEMTTPDAKRRELHASYDEPGVFAKDHTLVKIGPHLFEGNLDTYTVRVDPNNSDRLWVSLSDGSVHLTTNATSGATACDTAPFNTSTGVTGRAAQSIAVDPNDSNRAIGSSSMGVPCNSSGSRDS